jgi:hypothetical protein
MEGRRTLGTLEWCELDLLTARLNELRNRRRAVPKGRIGWLRELDSQILTVEAQRERLLSYLTRRVVHRIAA